MNLFRAKTLSIKVANSLLIFDFIKKSLKRLSFSDFLFLMLKKIKDLNAHRPFDDLSDGKNGQKSRQI